MENISITLEGPAASGKSRLMFLLGEVLKKEGFNVSFAADPDYSNEEDMLKKLGNNIDSVISGLKGKTSVVLKTKLSGRS